MNSGITDDDIDWRDSREMNGESEEWKQSLKNDFEQWLEDICDMPQVEACTEELDLYSFYKELCVLRNEVRRGGRKNQDILGRFGEGLTDFQKTLTDLQDRFIEMNKQKKEEGLLSQKRHFLPLVHILERLERLKERLNSPPKKKFFKNYEAWRETWEKFKQGFDISFSHLDELLKKEGITRIETVGKPFDPEIMAATVMVPTDEYPPDSVLEEISSGFLYKGNILKMAEVKVARVKDQNQGK